MRVREDFYTEDAVETVGGPLGHLEDELLDPRYFSAAMWENFYEDIALDTAKTSHEAQRTRAEQLTFDIFGGLSSELSSGLSQAGGSR